MAPVEHFGIRPAELVVDELLAPGGVLEVDPANDVGDPQQVVVDPALEVEHRPAPVVGGFRSGVGRPDEAEGDPVPQRRVRGLDVGSDPEDHLPRRVVTRHHRIELLPGGLRLLLAMRTRLAVVLQGGELRGRTGARVGAAELDQLTGVLVIGFQPVGGPDHPVGLEAEILDVLEDLVVGRQVRPFRLRIGIVEPTDEPAVVALLVGPDHRRHSGVSEVPRAVRVGRQTHPDLLVLRGVRQVRKRLFVRFRLGVERFDELGGELLEPGPPLVGIELVHLADHRPDEVRDLVAVLPELGVFAQQRTHDRPDLRVAVVFERVEEGVALGRLADPVGQGVVHQPDLPQPGEKRFGFGAATQPASSKDGGSDGSTAYRLSVEWRLPQSAQVTTSVPRSGRSNVR